MTRKSKKTATPVAPPKPQYPKVIETYGEPYMPYVYDRVEEPTDAINGMIRIDRYRLTVEKIEEPVEVLKERLLRLWHNDEHNSHHWEAFERMAKELGICKDRTEFQKMFPYDDHGKNRKRRR